MSTWDDKKIKILKENWGRLTASAIAEKIGGISRNAVIGKAHRLNLSVSIKSRNNTTNPVLKKQDTITNIGSPRLGRRSRFKSLLIENICILLLWTAALITLITCFDYLKKVWYHL